MTCYVVTALHMSFCRVIRPKWFLVGGEDVVQMNV